MSELVPIVSGPDETVFSRPSLSREDILALDRLAIAAWAAPEQEHFGGWLFRFAAGVSRRANSAAPLPPEANVSVDDLIAHTEEFYRSHDLPPRVQISPAAEPAGIDSILAECGYTRESAVTIMIADAWTLARDDRDDRDDRADVLEAAPEGWWDLYIEGFNRDARGVAARAADTPLFAGIPRNQDAIPALQDAIGLGIIGGNWLGLFGMYTRTEARKSGHGTRIIHALARKAVDRGAFGVYLQVEDDNPVARRFYENLGFRGVYGYHYRTLWNRP
ncbi:GNAT family N-acetyltransferase [Thalassospiraceae bacterium LMO-JJ14]|nr:GNAT family N-acetyltransferase [Thalassospiraceae bacterium LMO-JJ14]